jgi:hypothetical protein
MQKTHLKSPVRFRKDMIILTAACLFFVAALTRVSVLKGDNADIFHLHPLSLLSLIVAALVMAAVIIFIWWRNIDEAAREAHKWSWYWGGSAGLCIVLVLFLLVNLTGGQFGHDIIAAWGLAGRELEAGMAAGVLPPAIGYTLAWGVWWVRRR